MKEKSVIIGKDSDELIRGLVEKEKRGKGKEKEKDLDKFIKELISGEKKPVSKPILTLKKPKKSKSLKDSHSELKKVKEKIKTLNSVFKAKFQ